MKGWYTTREAKGLTHRGQKVAKDKQLFLTVQQAELINAKGEKVAKLHTAPDKPDDVAVLEDWQEFQNLSKKLEKTEDTNTSEVANDAESSDEKKAKRRAARQQAK